MKRFILLSVCAMLLSTGIMAQYDVGPEYISPPFTDTLIELVGSTYEVFTPVGSLSVIQDTATAETIFFVSGDLEFNNKSIVWLGLASGTTSTGGLQIVVDSLADTTTVMTHKYQWSEDIGNSPLIVPFSFQQNLDTDSVAGAVTLYLNAKISSAYRGVKLRNVRIDGITNLYTQ